MARGVGFAFMHVYVTTHNISMFAYLQIYMYIYNWLTNKIFFIKLKINMFLYTYLFDYPLKAKYSYINSSIYVEIGINVLYYEISNTLLGQDQYKCFYSIASLYSKPCTYNSSYTSNYYSKFHFIILISFLSSYWLLCTWISNFTLFTMLWVHSF